MHHPTLPSTILALDIGASRIGVASANTLARIASPLATLQNEGEVGAAIRRLVEEYSVSGVVVGLPRGLQGQDTQQTKAVKDFGRALEPHIGVPLYWQDEALTSAKAEAELKSRGKPYAKADIDALAATYILEDFLRDNPGELR